MPPADATPPFHVALAVRDLREARAFYTGVLGCREGRSSSTWADFDLYGHQLVCHETPDAAPRRATHPVDGEAVPVPHCGVVLSFDAWRALADRVAAAGVEFAIAPCIRFAGAPGEQGTFFLYDPSGNALEFKGFRDLGALFRG